MDQISNSEMADAAPTPHDLPLIRREDYRPFPWLVSEIALDFDLALERTRITSRFTVLPNGRAPASDRLRLDGDSIAPLSLRVDGESVNDWVMDGSDLVLTLRPGPHEIEIVTEIEPVKNSQLMGLYASGSMLCTQCEAEGFRRITFFPDRPDVLSTYRVRMEGPRDLFPVLLSNGNLLESGEGEGNRHWALWHDPWPKPSYLFALVAGDLVANRSHFVTRSGRKVDLAVWVRREDIARTDHALESLKRAMAWDEERFGREYDLDCFNIVAVSDFNMGAMENKGLNIFNTKYVLADPETATDADYEAIESVIAHEYFHNWSGNRVTCRDWFELSLKEGFTVLRDQLFSEDMRGAALKRIEQVRILRAAQFPEDSGPLAHPIRPDSYREISNFYTATVYNKGAEVIRMMRSMVGPERFRKGCDLYFERHDGEAATCEDFVRAIEEGAEIDLGRFRRWYEQAGTPRVRVEMAQEGEEVVLRLSQQLPPTSGQPEKLPMPIPLRLALIDRDSGRHRGEQLIVLEEEQGEWRFHGHLSGKSPVLSINRGFTAPVIIERDMAIDDLAFLASHDDDPFSRYEAMQELSLRHMVAGAGELLSQSARASGEEAILSAFARLLEDSAIEDSMRAEMLGLPGLSYLMEQVDRADPGALDAERERLRERIGERLQAALVASHQRAAREAAEGRDERARAGARRLRSQALALIAAGDPQTGAELAARQYDEAANMTDRQGALTVLASLDHRARGPRLADFHERFAGNALVIDKWFTIQALSHHPAVLDHVRALAAHPDFTLRNPNRVRALYMAFAANPAFHDASGEGYRMIADLVLALDPINPQTAARFIAPLGRWRRIEPGRSVLMREQLERIAASLGLSRDTREQVTRSLG